MTDEIEAYWRLRLDSCKQALEKNNFKAFVARDAQAAKNLTLQQILPGLDVRSAAWGDSMTMLATGILDDIKKLVNVHLLQTFADDTPRREIIERRRQALLVDLFLSGSNAVTESGQLVNLDMVGNRVAPIAFGPRHVILYIGRNKITADLTTAMQRVKQVAAPMNAIRHPNLKTPCQKTGRCMDCNSPDRICNVWSIVEKSYPRHRIQVVLINADLGL